MPEDWVYEMMGELETDNREEGMKAAVLEFCRDEMAMEEETMDRLQVKKVFRPPGDKNSDKMFVEMKEEHMVRSFYRYARKLRKEASIFNFIPDEFRERHAEMKRRDYELRKGDPAYRTNI